MVDSESVHKCTFRYGIMLFYFFLCVIPGFISTPTSVNATLGSTATFNCSVTTGTIAWILNGSLLSQLNAADITASQVENTFFLHVPATEEYNNTVVLGAVAILGGDDLYSDPVVLKVQGMYARYYTSRGLKGHINGMLKPCTFI